MSLPVLALGLTLAGCSNGMEGLTGFMGGSEQPRQTAAGVQTSFGGVPVEQLRADQLCPSIIVRDGTETLRLYAGEERSPRTVRYQSQILETVVECTPGVGGYALAIGIAGRSLIGPQGAPATLDLPIRVVVFDTVNDQVLSSEIVRAAVTIPPGGTSAEFRLVNRQFTMPQPNRQADYQIIVGFDEVVADG